MGGGGEQAKDTGRGGKKLGKVESFEKFSATGGLVSGAAGRAGARASESCVLCLDFWHFQRHSTSFSSKSTSFRQPILVQLYSCTS